jgi:hypothetical protein
MTLHERVTAAVEKRLAVAQAATPGPWVYDGDLGAVVVIHDRDSLSSVASARMADAAFVAANDPARIIRDCRRDLKVLGRHHTYGLQLAPEFRKGCVHCQQGGGVCAEIRDLAEAYEIGVDDGDG